MDIYHIWFNLKDGVGDTEFAASASTYLNHLKGEDAVAGYRITRRKLGLGPPQLPQWHITLDFENMAQMDGAFGYVELIYALQNNITYGSVKNAAGNFVKASLDSTTAAAASMKTMPADFRVSITNAPGKDSYPISSFTWLLVPADWKDKNKQKVFVDFLNWMLDQGQNLSAQLNYAPLPDAVKQKEREAIKTIH